MRKRTTCLFGFAFVLALSFCFPFSAVAADMEGGLWITTNASGTEIILVTASFTHPDRHTWSLVSESPGMDYSLGGIFQNIAPVQEHSYGEGRMTGPDTLENAAMGRIRYNDGSIAYIMISKGKGTLIDSKTMKLTIRYYLFLDLDQDGLPDFQLGEPLEFPYTSRHISAAVPYLDSLPGPAEYPVPDLQAKAVK